MMNEVLQLIAEKFKEQKIIYAVGASGVLVAHHIIDTMRDIDIVVMSKHADKAKKVMDSLGMLVEEGKNIVGKNEKHWKYEVMGVEVEIMSDIHIKHEEGIYHQAFDQFHVDNKLNINGIDVPVMTLEDWYVLYSLFHKQERVNQIETYFKEYGLSNEDLLHYAMDGCLPNQVKEHIQRLIMMNMKADIV